jgi:hypothetical protein
MTPPTSAEERELEPSVIQRRILLSFCAIVFIGLLLSVVYLAGRGAAPTAVVVQAGDPVILKDVPPPPVQPEAPSPPLPSNTYLQVAALNRKMSDELADSLRSKGFQVTVATGPAGDLLRVLVGPVKTQAALARAQRDLQAAGLTSFVRRQPAP